MSVKAFLDTNILIYFYSENEVNKRNVVCDVLNNHSCVTSIQAMNEASNVWFKKSGWSGKKIKEHLDNIELVCDEVTPVQRETIHKALDLKDRYGFSYYDCLMLASSLENNCDVIFSEDMKNDQIIDDKLKIVNPFNN